MWCIIIPFLTGVICAYLGYLIGRSIIKDQISIWESKYNGLHQTFESTKKTHTTDINSWKNKLGIANSDLDDHKQKIATMVPSSEKEEWIQKHNSVNSLLVSANEKIALMVPKTERDDWKTKHDNLLAELNTLK